MDAIQSTLSLVVDDDDDMGLEGSMSPPSATTANAMNGAQLAAAMGQAGAIAGSGGKQPVVRSARACTVCRNAKMRCIGADDGAQQCQRCKRQNLECIFEKHRRGRKPGSKLSEHSKMLRRLEREMKAKGKDAASGAATNKSSNSASASTTGPRTSLPPLHGSNKNGGPAPPSHQPPPIQTSYKPQQQQQVVQSVQQLQQQPPLDLIPSDHPHSHGSGSSGVGSTPTHVYDMPFQVTYPSSDTRQTERDNNSIGGEESTPDADDAIYPARVVDRETKRHSFFRTILNPSDTSDRANVPGEPPKTDAERAQANFSPSRPIVLDANVQDPIAVGLLDEQEARVLFDLVFMRLNGFINLFDPRLHTVPYVRSRSPFLFSCIIMAGCKFWKAELYRQCQQIAHSFAYKAFAEGWQSVEVVQAFACLTYWKEPDDTRTWTYIGYACRMAVELGLNTYVGRPEGESEEQKRERRNRERTYLVLWVHDRALSMQTGRNWMLPEDDLVRHAKTWHEDSPMRPEDVIVAAMVNLRQIAAETTDVYRMQKGGMQQGHYSDVNHEILLHGCNSKLTAWMDLWDAELKRAVGQPFHYSFLGFFRLHVRLFLNSLGLQSSSTPLGRTSPSLQSLSICYTSAIQSLEIVTRQFSPWGLLRYGQDSMTVMSAYSAVFLIKLLRRTAVLNELSHTAAQDIHNLITQTADAYQEAALLAVSSSSAAYHARFLRAMLAKDAEWKIHRPGRPSMSSSRASPDGMDEDRHGGPLTTPTTAIGPYPPTPIRTNSTGHSGMHHPTSPHYTTFSGAPHPAAPPALHTPQMSPIETKPIIYRNGSVAPTSNGATAIATARAGAYPHYNMGMDYPTHGHSSMVQQQQQYPAATALQAQQQQPGGGNNSHPISSELDMRYSRTILTELGYPPMGVDPVAEWFTQVMGPSSCAGLP